MAKVARLLDKIEPLHYRLHIDMNAEEFTFHEQERIDFSLKRPSDSLTFHALGLRIDKARVGEHKAIEIKTDEEAQTVTLQFDTELRAGEHQLNLTIHGEIADSLHGLYRSRYEYEGQEKWLITTQFEAVHAREAFVCIDEPSAKATFAVELVVPSGCVAISNTNIVEETPGEAGRKIVRFAETPKMSTYLLAMLVGDFEHVEGVTPEGVTVRVYSTPGKAGQLDFALSTGIATLSFYNEYFGIPYPLSKLDMIAVPDFASGAMENWGAVTYRETALLLDPDATSLAHKQRVAEVITHELAHQWFGNLVTMAWWDDLWLNEGFASWMEVFAKDRLFPDWHCWTEYVSVDVASAMEMDALANTHPIQVPVDDPRALDEIFDAVSYSKGSSIINMLHHYLGAEVFRDGLRTYLKRHSYGNSHTSDLWQALAEASGKPVDAVMNAWTSLPGYPVVSYEEGEARQRRFFASPREAKREKGSSLWPIPFSVATPDGGETEPRLIEGKAAPLDEVVVGAEWFKPNPGQTSFFRSLYTEPMIAALEEPLSREQLDAVDRFGIVDDVFAATEAGLTSSVVALKLLESLRNETNYVVWQGLSGGFSSLLSVMEDDGVRSDMERFGHWLSEPNIDRLGWEPTAGESSFDQLMRPMVLQQGVRYDNANVTREALERFESWAKGGDIRPELRPVALYAAARGGGKREFDIIRDRYIREEVPQVKISLLGSLGRFRKPAQIDEFLDFGLSDKVRAQDTFIVVAYGFANRDAREKAWQWLQAHWPEFVTRYGAGGHMLDRFPLYAGSGFATHEMAKQIGDFFAAHPHPTIKRPTAQAVEGIELKADWFDRDREAIKQWLGAQKWA